MACKCITCSECDGFGNIWFSFSGKYLGKFKCSDMDEMDTCMECDGEGLAELCDECREAWEEEQKEFYN